MRFLLAKAANAADAEGSCLVIGDAQKAPLTTIALSPDGTLLLSPSTKQRAMLWELRTGKERAELAGHTAPLAVAVFNADASRALTAGGATPQLWDTKTGRRLFELKGHTLDVKSAAFNPDGKRVVTTSVDDTAKVWDSTTGREVMTLRGHEGSVKASAWSPGGTLIATGGSDNTVRLWNVLDGKERAVLRGHAETISHIFFAPDGKQILTWSQDQAGKLWDTLRGVELASLPAGRWICHHFEARTGRCLLLGSTGTTTSQIVDAVSGRVLASLQGHQGWVSSGAFSADGKWIVTGSFDKTVRVWDAETGRQVQQFDARNSPVAVGDVGFTLDGTKVLAGDGGIVRVWDRTRGAMLASADILRPGGPALEGRPMPPHAGTMTSIHTGGWVSAAPFDDSGTRFIASGGGPSAHVWDSDSGQHLVTLPAHEYQGVACGSYRRDGKRIVTGGYDNLARVCDAQTGNILATLKGHKGAVKYAAFSDNGARIVTMGVGNPVTDDMSVKVWDAESGELLESHDMPGLPYAVFLNPRGEPLSVVVYDLSDKGGGTTHVLDPKTGAVRASLLGHTFGVSTAAFSRDGSRVVTGSADNTAKVWDATTGRLIASMEGHRLVVNCVSFSPDGNLVVTAGGDATARIWDAWTGKLLAVFEGHVGPIGFAGFTSDGSRLLTVGWEGMARLWDVHLEIRSPDEMTALSQQRAKWRFADGRLLPTTLLATPK